MKMSFPIPAVSPNYDEEEDRRPSLSYSSSVSFSSSNSQEGPCQEFPSPPSADQFCRNCGLVSLRTAVESQSSRKLPMRKYKTKHTHRSISPKKSLI